MIDKKGISPILSTVLVVLVVIALAGTFLAFSGRSFTQVTETGSQQQQEFAQETQEGVEIASLSCDTDQISIRNSGSTELNLDGLALFVNDTSQTNPFSGTLQPDNIDEATVTSTTLQPNDNVRVVTEQGAQDSSVCPP